MQRRKLIEVALPLEAINRASLAEKNRKVGKPQNLHMWWSRKPITAARAMLLAQLIDDPSSRPDLFTTAEAVRQERSRLHALITRAVEWDEITKPSEQLGAEIRKLLPQVTITDPFVGGGSIPLAAAQFGVNSTSSDLNPLAVLLSRALVDIPARFTGREPVHPASANSYLTESQGATGLAMDVEAYGRWMLSAAEALLETRYPTLEGWPVLAWVWARSVICPSPACRIELPLVSKWWLAKKRGKEAYIVPRIIDDPDHPSGRRFAFSIGEDPRHVPLNGTMSGRTGTDCLACGASVPVSHVRAEGMAGRLGTMLTAVVCDTGSRRLYLPPSDAQAEAAQVERPPAPVEGEISTNPRWFSPPLYGMREFSDLFTDRQLLAITTLGDLVDDARELALKDALAAGHDRGVSLASGGVGAEAYADAVAVYLSLTVSRLTDWSNNQCRWEANGEVSQQMYSGQAMGMAWDFSEANVLGDGNSGSFLACLKSIVGPLRMAHVSGSHTVHQADVRSSDLGGHVVATDPPYFDNIGYSDLSDFFYVWNRRILRSIYPDLFGTILVPKADELVANAYRSGSVEAAGLDFLVGFKDVFEHLRTNVSPDFPVVVYYASKQTESLRGGNSRWSTILQAMVDEGWQIVRTWPIRTENVSRRVAIGSNSMSTSTVLVLRPRSESATAADLPSFLGALRQELSEALEALQAGGVAPVDLPQAAIGPGMAIFSRYSAVLESDGSPMTVTGALARVNEMLDEVLNEQEGDFDAPTRFAIQWYRHHGYKAGDFGDADDLARVRNTSVDAMAREGIIKMHAGRVELVAPIDLPAEYDPTTDTRVSHWEVLQHAIRVLDQDGITLAGELVRVALTRADQAIDSDLVKELAHLAFRIAEKNGWTKDALSFNNLVTSWPEIFEVARSEGARPASQFAFDFEDDE